MKANRGVDTRPEQLLRRLLHARGLRYRVNLRFKLHDVAVRPDIVFTRRRVAVFVLRLLLAWMSQAHVVARSNREFWRTKIEGIGSAIGNRIAC